MAKFTIEWHETRTVWTEVEAKNKKDAISKLMNGEGCESDWQGGHSPDSVDYIDDVTQEIKGSD